MRNSNSLNQGTIFEWAHHDSLQWAQHESLDNLRHRTEFETLCPLGSGAFGTTYKVRNRVDSKIYALKRVPLGNVLRREGATTTTAAELVDSDGDIKRVLREVEVLSSLNHENVVRYYGAWVEKGDTTDNDNDSTPLQERQGESAAYSYTGSGSGTISGSGSHYISQENEECTTNTSSTEHHLCDTPKDPVCHLCHRSYTDWEVSFEEWGLIAAVLQPMDLCTDCYKNSLPSDADTSTIQIRQKQIHPQFLFILMEFCESTLLEAVETVNKKTNIKQDDDANTTTHQQKQEQQLLWSYFAQMCAGIGTLSCQKCYSSRFESAQYICASRKSQNW